MKKIKKIIKQQSFQPNFLSLFINPFFFIRKGLYKKIKLLAPSLKGSVLDFGCGRKPYQNQFVNATSYIGVDMQTTGHDHEHSKVDTYYDGKRIPFSDNYFDNIFSSEVFEHVDNLDEIIKELNRVLKNEGKILITVPFVWNEHETPYDFRRFSKYGIEDLLKKSGFSILETHTTTHYAETLLQLKILYVYHLFYSKNKILNLLLTLIFIAPLNIIGGLFTLIVPKNKSFYHNAVILAKKIE